jgi:hypothetical protein
MNTREKHISEIKNLLKCETMPNILPGDIDNNLTVFSEETLEEGSVLRDSKTLMDKFFATCSIPNTHSSNGIDSEILGYRMESQIDRSK